VVAIIGAVAGLAALELALTSRRRNRTT
jgi:hypothetical protein